MTGVLPNLDPAEIAAELLRRKEAKKNLARYMEFVNERPTPRHLEALCKQLHRVANGRIHRLVVAFPPGHAKSTTVSLNFPAWYMSHFPDKNIIHVTHTQEFAERWGRRIRNQIRSDAHQKVFPRVGIAEDSAAAGRWETNKGGEYFATGVGGTVTGRRADGIVVDDPLRGIEDAESERVREAMWDWYGADLTTRLKPGGWIAIVATRWHLDDLTGRLLAAEDRGEGEKWTRFILPAIALPSDPLGRKPGEALWPEWESLEALEQKRRQPAMTPRKWSCLYQQNPVVDSGGIFDRNWFRWWKEPTPPKIIYKIQSWDTALTAKDGNAWTACSTWGVFEDENKVPNLILLNATRWRVEYPDLRRLAQQLAQDYRWDKLAYPAGEEFTPNKALRPDTVLIEAKVSGISLIQDLARAGIVATRFDPDRHGDKLQRVRIITDLVENGRIWLPAQPPAFSKLRSYAEMFLEQCVQFPAADSRDMVDTFTQVLHRIKASGWLRNTEDPEYVDDYAARRETAEPFY